MDWLAFTGIFFLGGLSGLFLMGLFVGAVNGFQKPQGMDEKEKKFSLPHLPFSRTVELATHHHPSASPAVENLSLDLDGRSGGSQESRISVS